MTDLYEKITSLKFENTKENLQTAVNDMIDALELQTNINLKLREEIASLKSEKYESEEIQRLSKVIEEYRETFKRCFYISEFEKDKLEDWKKDHINKKHNGKNPYTGAIGGHYSYHFLPTSIGTIGTIKCELCGDTFDFQEL